MPRARYYISLDAGLNYSEFWPSNEPKVNYVKEGDEIFYRPRVDKFRIARTKNQAVYDSLYNRFFDPAYFATDIIYKINVLGVDKFFFIDPITSGDINTQDSVYDSTPDTDDVYRPILKQYDRKWQDRTADHLFNLDSEIHYPVLITTDFVNVNFSTFADAAHSVTWSNTAFGTKQRATHVHAIVSLIGDIYIIQISNYVVIGNDVKTQLVNAAGASLSNEETITGDGFYYLTQTVNDANVYLEISEVNTLPDSDPASGSFDYILYEHDHLHSGDTVENILGAIINGVSYMNLGLTIVSTILWNDALGSDPPPAIDTYMTAHPTNDYVITSSANFNYLWIGRTDSFTTAKEDLVETSLKDIMAILRKLRLYWFIDEDGKFRIEHQRYFREYTTQADLTSATYLGDKPEVDQRIYNYEKKDSYSQINYKENNQSHKDWIAYPVLFYGTIAEPQAKDISFNITTDIEYLLDSPGDASSSGLFLTRTKYSGLIYYIPLDASTITPMVYYMNAKLSWAWLIANYYDYFAEAETGTVNNGSAITYTHVKEYLKQGNIKFRMAADLDWKKPFTLIEGTGWLEVAEYAPETGMYKISVGYNPYTIEIAIVDSEDMGIIITDSAGTDLIV
jgi:hypothetical protein